jgi:hypothetical protein
MPQNPFSDSFCTEFSEVRTVLVTGFQPLDANLGSLLGKCWVGYDGIDLRFGHLLISLLLPGATIPAAHHGRTVGSGCRAGEMA